MRIAIDMQGAQTESRFRGIGRYTMSLVRALIRNRGDHDIVLVLSGLFPETIEPIRSEFNDLISQDRLRVWHALTPVREVDAGNKQRRCFAETVREAFISDLQPDALIVTSLFEGYGDDAVTSVARFDTLTPVFVILYDLIPLVNSTEYLDSNPSYSRYYREKLEQLKCANHLFAISEFSRQEGMALLGRSELDITNISSATDVGFYQSASSAESFNALARTTGISGRFVLYTGGADERKNLPRLLKAYALIPAGLRSTFQLVLAGKMPAASVAQLELLAKAEGLGQHQLVFTGYVDDSELFLLYRSCDLYVFPSWHEGFGLPALEAMACGAPVIGANTSSLPEVIGYDAALFDPFDVEAIATKIEHALTDDAFRAELRAHGLTRSKEFSWDATAKLAIKALESTARPPRAGFLQQSLTQSRLYKALSPTIVRQDEAVVAAAAACLAQNQQTGFERQLLLDVSELCRHDAATGVQRVVRSYLKWLLSAPPLGYRVEPVFATQTDGYRYARSFVLRFLAQESQPDIDIDTPVSWQRGDIFFGLDMQHHVQLAHQKFYQNLRMDGVIVKFLVYDLLPIQLPDFFRESGASDLHSQLLKMIAMTDGVICISKATSDSYRDWLTEGNIRHAQGFENDWVHMGADLKSAVSIRDSVSESDGVVEKLGDRPTFLCVSTLEPRKGQQQILDAMELLWRDGHDLNLVFVGQQGWKVDVLARRLKGHPEKDKRLFWLEGISDDYLEQVYAASNCLIAASINEGFGLPLIEGARNGLPIIARDIPVFREIAGEGALYFSGLLPGDLARTVENWLDLYKADLHPDSSVIRWSTWEQSAENLKEILCGSSARVKQLLVDVSELVQRDARTGIQRVVRSVLTEWLRQPPKGWRVEPVYATESGPYRYAREFVSTFLDIPSHVPVDTPVEFAPGDIFFALDYQPQIQVTQSNFYQYLRQQGVTVKFMLYDLLCVSLPSYFPSGSGDGHSAWLNVVAETDGVVCISESVAKEMQAWMKSRTFSRLRNFSLDWNHLGADIDDSCPSEGLPSNWNIVVEQLATRTSFLMVGTLEPRKGHVQVLDAFEQLWREGSQTNLVIVGKAGWMVDELIARLQSHPEREKRMFWLEAISDEYLEKVYDASSCLIAASFGEGFGLPLIEAAQHKLPIIARDIQVFREVAAGHASYFAGDEPQALVNAIRDWLLLYESNQHPKSDDMPWLTWSECVQQLNQKLVKSNKLN